MALRDLMVLAILLSYLLALHHPRLLWQHGHMYMYSADNIEPHFTGVVICYLLASDNTALLPCKHHEYGSENATKVCILPAASPCKCSLYLVVSQFVSWSALQVQVGKKN